MYELIERRVVSHACAQNRCAQGAIAVAGQRVHEPDVFPGAAVQKRTAPGLQGTAWQPAARRVMQGARARAHIEEADMAVRAAARLARPQLGQEARAQAGARGHAADGLARQQQVVDCLRAQGAESELRCEVLGGLAEAGPSPHAGAGASSSLRRRLGSYQCIAAALQGGLCGISSLQLAMSASWSHAQPRQAREQPGMAP